MPVNSFDDYPMAWRPDKSLLEFPIYHSLSQLLEQDILNGRLPPNTKLPPQRELADFLDLNLSTITRAFKLCETKGLIYAIIGKGTFVSPNAALPHSTPADTDNYIELGPIRPYYQFNSIVADTAKEILRGPHAARLFEFSFTLGNLHQKQVAKRWLAGFHMDAPAEDIILASGTQNALAITLLTLFQSGDKVATDAYTYTNFISLARQLQIQLVPIQADLLGMLPEELEKQVKLQGIKGVYLMPSCTNPTGITLPMKRRNELAKVIGKYHVTLIEDDTYGFISDHKISPMATLLPAQTVYLHGISKSLSAGLRIAYLVFPHRFQKAFLNTANNINLKIPLLNAEIASALIAGGTAHEIIKKKCMLSEERNLLYRKYFPGSVSRNPYTFFQWLPLSAGCNGYNFEVQAKNHGVKVLCSERFAVGGTQEFSAVRIATCSPQTIGELETGLKILKKLSAENNPNFNENEFII